MTKALKRFYVVLIFIFLYAPIGTLIVLSFNKSRTRAKWGGFTFKWYIELFQNRDIMEALYTTLAIAFISSLIATVIGTAACIGMNGMHKRTKALLMGVTNIPMLNADIVTGISLMLLFVSVGLRFGMETILLAHITFNIPFVILSIFILILLNTAIMYNPVNCQFWLHRSLSVSSKAAGPLFTRRHGLVTSLENFLFILS